MTKTKTKTEAYDIYNDIEGNLLPLIRQFANTHCARAEDLDDKESKKQLDRIQKRLVKLIQDVQPMPYMGSIAADLEKDDV